MTPQQKHDRRMAEITARNEARQRIKGGNPDAAIAAGWQAPADTGHGIPQGKWREPKK